MEEFRSGMEERIGTNLELPRKTVATLSGPKLWVRWEILGDQDSRRKNGAAAKLQLLENARDPVDSGRELASEQQSNGALEELIS